MYRSHDDQGSSETLDLRARAEDNLRGSPAPERNPLDGSEGRLIYELRVHKVELEMQNEELRRVQLEVEEARARYFDLYDLAPVAYLTLNADGRIVEANLNAAELFGVGRNALVAQPFHRYIAEEDRDTYYKHRKRPLEPGGQGSCELVLVHADGTRFWAHLADSVVLDSGGKRLFRLVLTNISQRKKRDADKAGFLAAVERVSEAVVLCDLTGAVQYVNPAFEASSGYTRAEAMGKNMSFMKSGRHSKAFYEELWDTITSGRAWKGRFLNHRKDGSLIVEEACVTPVFDDEENIINYVAVTRPAA